MKEDRATQQQRKEALAHAKTRSASNKKSTFGTLDGKKASGGKRARTDDSTEDVDTDDGDDRAKKRVKGEAGVTIAAARREDVDEDVDCDEPPIFDQPALVTGGKLKSYQLEGLQWMVSLDQNGISGILGERVTLKRCFHI